MIRKIVKINEEKCNGCGLCVTGCHEGALQIIDGKAKLVTDSYCDGLGACLPACPMDAIALEEREAEEFDEVAVEAYMSSLQQQTPKTPDSPAHTFSCPGTAAKAIDRAPAASPAAVAAPSIPESQLRQWPCQIKLVPVNAPYFKDAKLLIAADCTAYAYANFHQEFMQGKITIIGCPKLDDIDYTDKLTDILKYNDIKNLTVLRMEVPCCGGIEFAAKQALINSGKMIPWQIITISTDGRILD